VGAYHAGSDPTIDEAIRYRPRLERFLKQPQDEPRSFSRAVEEIQALVEPAAHEENAS
jgi:flagellar biosynthesis/type III secretory pathway ATPase